jgi:SAPK-interacting protein 1 (Sin1), middle CRIM domain/Stress-activated map kinase interacting protein 1 (SIN1)
MRHNLGQLNFFFFSLILGISELVMNSDDLAKNLSQMYLKESWIKNSPGSEKSIANETCFFIYPDLLADNEDDDNGFELSQSFDINFTKDLPFYRFRTNTEAKLVKLSDIKKKQSRIVKVDDSVVKLNQEIQDNDELFIRKDLSNVANEPHTSQLSFLLESLPKIKLNKFREFSTLDGSSFPSNETKSIEVFITPLKELRDYPVKCCVHSNAKIEEFIGYILFRVVNEYPQHADALEEVKSYGLFISDESGEADYDFPPLGLTELISKYQFKHLALAKRLNAHFQNRTLSLSVASDTTTMIYPVKRQASIETNKSLPTNIRQSENAMTVHDSMVILKK